MLALFKKRKRIIYFAAINALTYIVKLKGVLHGEIIVLNEISNKIERYVFNTC